MSQGSLGGSARVTPPQHDLGRPRPLSLHDDLCLRKKQPFRSRLLGSETPNTLSVEMVSLDGSRTLESARSSHVLRGGAKTRCPACQARRSTQSSSLRNTQRISFLHSEFGGRKISRDECQDLECNSKAFLDHLLKVEASSSTETPSSSRSHSPKESRKREKQENGRQASDGSERKEDRDLHADATRAPTTAAQEPEPRRPSQGETTDPAPAEKTAKPVAPAKANRFSATSSDSNSDTASPSDASSGGTRDQTAASSPSSAESSLSDVGRTDVPLRPKNADVSSDLLAEVSRGIYDKHASWAPWVPDLYPPLHEDTAISEDNPISEDRSINEDSTNSEDHSFSETEAHGKNGVPENVHEGTNELHDGCIEGYDNLSYVD